uniref:Uncharacterized protein n=1 Tax=Oryza glumipatula TaxID=40148 RepID=A0A0D9Y9B7_9ORYZ
MLPDSSSINIVADDHNQLIPIAANSSVELALRLKLSFRKKIACLSQFVLSCTFYIRSSLCFDC